MPVGVRSCRGGGEILRAWPAVVRRLPSARLVLAGCWAANDREELADLAAEMGVGGTVTVRQAGVEAPGLLAAADVVADVSWAGAAVRDAMALGRPVVAVARAGNLESSSKLASRACSCRPAMRRRSPRHSSRFATDAALAVRFASAAHKVTWRGRSLAVQLAELEGLHQKLGVPAGAQRAITPADR